MHHGRGDFVRAVMEAWRSRSATAVELSRRFIFHSREIRLIGGGAKDRLWAQIVCDVMGVPADPARAPDASSGSGHARRRGRWCFFQRTGGGARRVHSAAELSPRATEAETYSRLFATYRRIHDVLAEVYHRCLRPGPPTQNHRIMTSSPLSMTRRQPQCPNRPRRSAGDDSQRID